MRENAALVGYHWAHEHHAGGFDYFFKCTAGRSPRSMLDEQGPDFYEINATIERRCKRLLSHLEARQWLKD